MERLLSLWDIIKTNAYAQQTLTTTGILLLSLICYGITKKILVRSIRFVIKKSKTQLDDILVEHNIFTNIASVAPFLVIYLFAHILPFTLFVQRLTSSIIMFFIAVTILNVVNAGYEIYNRRKSSKQGSSIKGYIQILKIAILFLGIIIIIANLLGKSPIALLSGIGAMTAILLLIFKDTILSLMASIQINSYKLIRVGDWIEMPKFGADGDVVDISLHTITVQNWDKTIISIPTHHLLEQPFKNWKGMYQAGGRRIKRAFYIDMATIQFCDETLLAKLSDIDLLSDYLPSKEKEIQQYNEVNKPRREHMVNGRRLTNVGIFRAYIYAYLKQHPSVHKDLTLIVRQLSPTERGLPIEIYVFCTDTRWVEYEGIQSDIFDHILASAMGFSLRIFQNPTGYDYQCGLEQKRDFSPAREDLS